MYHSSFKMLDCFIYSYCSTHSQNCLRLTEGCQVSTFQIAVDEQLLRWGRRRVQVLGVQGLRTAVGAVGAGGDVGHSEGAPEHDGGADHARQEHGDHPQAVAEQGRQSG